MGRIARNTFTFSSRTASALNLIGGSIAMSESSCRRWFWNMSRPTPALEAVPERLLDDHPHPRRCPGIPLLGRNAAPVEVTDYLRVHAGRDRQVEQATPSRGARAVPVHSLQPRSERGVGLRVVQVP